MCDPSGDYNDGGGTKCPKDKSVAMWHIALLLISVVFLALTIVVITSSSDSINLHGRLVISHAATLLVKFVALATGKMPSDNDHLYIATG